MSEPKQMMLVELVHDNQFLPGRPVTLVYSNGASSYKTIENVSYQIDEPDLTGKQKILITLELQGKRHEVTEEDFTR